MKNLSSVKNYLAENKKDVLIFSVILLVILNFLVLNIYVISQVPLFDDGTYHASIVREMRNQERIIDYSPVGWVMSPILIPISLKPVVQHLPLFYLTNTVLTCFVDNVELSMTITNLLSIIFLIVIFFKLLKNIFSKPVAFYSSILLAFAPMFLIVTGIRLMEGLLYFFGIITIYQYFKYLKRSSIRNTATLVLFITTLFWLKITSIFLVLAIFVHFLIKNKPKKTLFIFIVILFLSLPLFDFMINTNGTISGTPPGIPIIDKYIFNPWWNWDRAEWDNQMTIDSDWLYYEEKMKLFGGSRTPTLQDNLKSVNISNLVQYFSIYPTFVSGRLGEYTPLADTSNLLFLLIFILGVIVYLKLGLRNKNEKNFIFLLLILGMCYIPFFMAPGALFRHSFFLQILCTVFFGNAIYFITQKIKIMRIVKICFIGILVISLVSVSIKETENLLRYKYSFGHVIMSTGGRIELREVSREIMIPENENIFAPSEEICWYMNRPVVWDYRIFFVPKEKVSAYFKHFNASYLIIPHYMLKRSINGKPNIKENWIKHVYSIPTDSGFYELLEEGKYFKKVKDYKAFTVYKFEHNIQNDN